MTNPKRLKGKKIDEREVWSGGVEGKIQGYPIAPYRTSGHQGIGTPETDEGSFLAFIGQGNPRCIGKKGASHSFPEPAWLCSDDGMSYLRLGAQVQEL